MFRECASVCPLHSLFCLDVTVLSVAASFLVASLSVRAEGCSSSSVMFTQLSILLSHNTELQGPHTSNVTRCQSITAVILCTGQVSRIWWVSQGIVNWVTVHDFFLLFLFWVELSKTQCTITFSKWLSTLINTVSKAAVVYAMKMTCRFAGGVLAAEVCMPLYLSLVQASQVPVRQTCKWFRNTDTSLYKHLIRINYVTPELN